MKLQELFETVRVGRGCGLLSLNKQSANEISQFLQELGIKNIVPNLHVTTIFDE
jgi:hypothetical protein